MTMKKSRKIILLLLGIVLLLGIFIHKETYASFVQGYTTEDDIVHISYDLDINTTNIEEYELVDVQANYYTIFNVHLTNDTSDKVFYGIWYKYGLEELDSSKVAISKLNTSKDNTSGEIELQGSKDVTIMVKNYTNQNIQLKIGVNSSSDSVQSISYTNQKNLIRGVMYESDYYYDTSDGKYYSSKDSKVVNLKKEVPTLDVLDKLELFQGEVMDLSKIRCSDNGNGCRVVMIHPADTTQLSPAIYDASFIVMDRDGVTYKYTTKLTIKSGSLASAYIKNLYHDGRESVKYDFGGEDFTFEVSLNERSNIMLDNNGEYRYYGKNPNNYVLFNGELWRIISLSSVLNSDEVTNASLRLKLVRNHAIGNYSYDSSENAVNEGFGVNDFSKSDIALELNNLYYASKQGVCFNGRNNASVNCNYSEGLKSNARSMIDKALYYTGGMNTIQDMFATSYYLNERIDNTYVCEADDGACPREGAFVGNVSLMYASDYGYAVDVSKCNKSLDKYDEECVANNWLYKENGLLLLNPTLNRANSVYYINGDGKIDVHFASESVDVYPVVYLKSSVHITGGVGTVENPYTLSL